MRQTNTIKLSHCFPCQAFFFFTFAFAQITISAACNFPHGAIPNEYIKLNLKYTKFPAYFLYFVPKIAPYYPSLLLCFPKFYIASNRPLSEGLANLLGTLEH